MKKLLTTKIVAEDWLAVDQSTVSRMVHENRIPHIVLARHGKRLTVRFDADEIARWIERRSRGPVPQEQK